MNSEFTGKVFKIPLPFTDLKTAKALPALAIGEPDTFGDIQFIFITTKQTRSPSAELDVTDGLLSYESHLHLDKTISTS